MDQPVLSALSFQPYFNALASRGHRLTLVTWVPDDEFCDMDNVECVRVGKDLSSLMESKNFFTGNLTIFGETMLMLQCNLNPIDVIHAKLI